MMIFHSSLEFSAYIEHLVKLNNISHLDAVIMLMNTESIDEVSVAKLLTPAMKALLYECYKDNGMITNSATDLSDFEMGDTDV
jgi:hypothetical protein